MAHGLTTTADLAEDLAAPAEHIGDLSALFSDEMHSAWEGTPGPLTDALGHDGEFSGAVFGADVISAAFSTRWGIEARCVHLLVDVDGVRTDITDSATCKPRPVPA